MIIKANELFDKFNSIVTGKSTRQVMSTGFKDVDEYIKFSKNYLAVVTGFPGSGKSEFVDAVALNMALMHRWKTLYFSPENNPLEEHMAKIAERFVGKNIKGFKPEQIETSLKFIDEYFSWVDPDVPTLTEILDRAKDELMMNGLDVLVIDPWNAIHHSRGMLREDEYLMEALSKLLVFARKNNILVIVVAHPKTLQPDKERKIVFPTVSEISGGAMWWNKADYAIVCHRPDKTKNEMVVSVQKVKQKWMGKVGVSILDYDWKSGRYKCKGDDEFRLPTDIIPPF